MYFNAFQRGFEECPEKREAIHRIGGKIDGFRGDFTA